MEYKKKKVKNKKQIKVLKYEEHPEFVGNEIEVAIINNEKTRPTVKNLTTQNKPKQPRMTINQLVGIVNQLTSTVNNLAVEMRAGFGRINTEIAAVNQKIDKEVGEIKETLKRHEEIFERNNLK
jgi:hypothetical protein